MVSLYHDDNTVSIYTIVSIDTKKWMYPQQYDLALRANLRSR